MEPSTLPTYFQFYFLAFCLHIVSSSLFFTWKHRKHLVFWVTKVLETRLCASPFLWPSCVSRKEYQLCQWWLALGFFVQFFVKFCHLLPLHSFEFQWRMNCSSNHICRCSHLCYPERLWVLAFLGFSVKVWHFLLVGVPRVGFIISVEEIFDC